MRTRTDKQRPLRVTVSGHRAPSLARAFLRLTLHARSTDAAWCSRTGSGESVCFECVFSVTGCALEERRRRRVLRRRLLGFSFRLCKLQCSSSRGRPCSSRGNVNQDGCHRSAKCLRDDRARHRRLPKAVGNVALRGGAVVQARAGLGRCAPRPTSTAGGTKSRGWSVGDRGRAAAMGVCASKPGAEPPKPEASAPLGSGVNESVPPRSAAAREQLWPTTAGGGTPSPTPSSR
jgi:hypothetical protein